MKDQKQQLTIDQIKEKYPHQYVGLTNIKYKENSNLIESEIKGRRDKNE